MDCNQFGVTGNNREDKGKQMVKSKTEIMDAIKEVLKGDSSDSTLSFIEDITDTLDDLESKANDTTDWKQKYEDKDREWREKYKERFFSAPVSGSNPVPNTGTTVDDDSPTTYEDLFKTGGK